MRLNVQQPNLAKALSVVGRAVSSRSTLPVLGNVLLEARDDQLRVAATNLEVGVSCWIPAKVEDEGAITIPARLLTDFVGNLPPEPVKLELNNRTLTLHLMCRKFEANMKGIDAADFPIMPSIDEEQLQSAIAFNTADLRKMIDQVAFAASSDESRPTLTGIEVGFYENQFNMAATDGYRLSIRRGMHDRTLSKPVVVIVPAKSLNEFARIAADANDEPTHMVITPERNQLLIRIHGKADAPGGGFYTAELASQLIDAKFPDYRAIIPKNHLTRTVIDTGPLLKAARVAFLFARDNANIIRLQFNPPDKKHPVGSVGVSSTSTEAGDTVNDIDAAIEGEPLEIAVNARYMIDYLSNTDAPQVIITTSQPTRPLEFVPLGCDPEDSRHVVMPMHPPR
jgi:DNA polymerase III subunit beta